MKMNEEWSAGGGGGGGGGGRGERVRVAGVHKERRGGLDLGVDGEERAGREDAERVGHDVCGI